MVTSTLPSRDSCLRTISLGLPAISNPSHAFQSNKEHSGRFDESSLPPRPKFDWLSPSPPHDAALHRPGSLSPKQPARSRPVSPSSVSQSEGPRATPERATSPRHLDADLANGSIPTPRSAVDRDDSRGPSRDPPASASTHRHKTALSSGKAATPHSPPDSPESEFLDAHSSRLNSIPSDTLQSKLKDQINVQNQEPGNLARQGSAPPSTRSPKEQYRTELHGTEIKPSAWHYQLARGTSLPPSGSPLKHRVKPKTSARTTPRRTPEPPGSLQAHHFRKDTTEREASSPEVNGLPVSIRRQTPDRTSVECPTTGQDRISAREPLNDVENVRNIPKRTRADLKNAAALPPSKRVKREKSSVVVKLAKADRYVPAARHHRFIRGSDYRHPGGKKDYMHILFLRQSLDSGTTFKTDLNGLLTSTSKTLMTSDWEASLHEKHECAVVKRVYDWQQHGKWPLRQSKPQPEPATPPTHWDHLLAEAKWLQTDFREERKLKLYTCRDLAMWCSEWHEASTTQRKGLLVRKGCKIAGLGRNNRPGYMSSMSESDEALIDEGYESALLTADSPLERVFDPEHLDCKAVHSADLSQELIDRLPLFEPWKANRPQEQDLSISADMQRMADIRQAIAPHDSLDGSHDIPAPELPPEDTSCAIFDPAWKQLRARVNANLAFKAPSPPMPPMGFYEHRRASQWTQEDDHQLKQFAKDFPSNWPLISDRLSSRSQFMPSIHRRTPWECYERLLSMEGVYSDAGMRQYARQFQMSLDRICARWQQNVQQTMQAQGLTQQLQHSPPRFPSPLRVERKLPSRRFACILDGARKLARKREIEENKRKQTHQESQVQGPRVMPVSKAEASMTPQYWSQKKYEAQEEHKRQQVRMRQQQQQQAAIVKAQQQQQQQQQQQARQANQALYNGGLSQRTGSRGADAPSSVPQTNGRLAVPGQGAHRGHTAQASTLMPTANGSSQSSSQLAAQLSVTGRPQSNASMQRSLAPGFTGGQPMPGQDMHPQVMQAQHIRQQQQAYQAQRQMSQSHVNQRSPTLGSMNGMSNPNPMNPLGSANGDSVQSPRLPQGTQSASNHTSPNMAQQMMAPQFAGGRPHQLSSGHVTVLENLKHKIAQDNPQLTETQILELATSHLQKSTFDQNNVNYAQNRALNAAAGVHQMSQQQSSRPSTQQGMSNPPQSPYLNSQQSPYLQNSMLANHVQARSNSPGSATQQQQSYTQSMQAQITQQMRRNGMMSGGASNPASSPPMAPNITFPNGPARTPTPGQNPMRPPSSAMMDNRPGSAVGISMGSPRPMSSQGVP